MLIKSVTNLAIFDKPFVDFLTGVCVVEQYLKGNLIVRTGRRFQVVRRHKNTTVRRQKCEIEKRVA